MSSYKISQRADEDILSIARYTIATFGAQQAEIYHAGLHKTFDFLASNPAAARERTEIDPPVRAHRYQSHLVVYEIAENGDVLILRVPHAKTDWLND
ncbi:plasmid stabilization protein ParE [Erythrobacter sp. QSSC1-22B]|uniref:type II toxin-antitoxin system RelE/ParE family toxin n=1 Tax=Erythrobacter sp. QSSC1-22B TaxID=1860125 RepID=UPI0008049ACC|nr:type II toxin-antitoxin system RelE/ParE family toxin [Erythrobacter sp. QSSC1-22B]OBX17940.1 plasmid stabilization protein ParE [Erythrobacter sp. QSSC1-22B]